MKANFGVNLNAKCVNFFVNSLKNSQNFACERLKNSRFQANFLQNKSCKITKDKE